MSRNACLSVSVGLVFSGALALANGCSGPTTNASTTSALTVAVDILTQHNDSARTGANVHETVLTPSSVAGGSFGKLFSRKVDGAVFAQPLVVSGDAGARNVVVVATEHNTVYAFDADRPETSAPIWSKNLGPSVPATDTHCRLLAPEIGITSTPVIDKATKTIWVVAKTKRGDAYANELHALDLTTGAEKANSPVEIIATAPGTGDGSEGGKLTLDPLRHMSRPGLLLVNGSIVIAFASQCDVDPYHGWVVTYDAVTLRQTAVHVDTPSGSEGGIWHGAAGLATDDSGDIYYASGNGTFDGSENFGNSLVRLHQESGALKVTDFFTPADSDARNQHDLDLGSTGILLVPGTNLAVSGDKGGVFYVVRRDAMGHISSNDGAIVQKFQGTVKGAFGGPAYYGGRLVTWGTGDVLKSYPLAGNDFAAAPIAQGTITTGYPGGQVAISADDSVGLGSAIVWTVRGLRTNPGLAGNPGPGVLQAFALSDLRPLYTSDAPADALGDIAKFGSPTIANGKVYVGSASGTLVVYGLGRSAADAGVDAAADASDGSANDGSAPDAAGAPTFADVFATTLGPGTAGHCTNCHGDGRGNFQCKTRQDCYASLVSGGYVTPGPTAASSPLGVEGESPLSWFGGLMPEDDSTRNDAAARTITAWLAGGAKEQ